LSIEISWHNYRIYEADPPDIRHRSVRRFRDNRSIHAPGFSGQGCDVAISPLLLRSRHIYIVFCSLIHLVLGVYLQIRPQSWRKILQYVGSALLASSALLLVFAFVQENYYLQHFSALSAFGVFSSLAGVGLHVIGGFVRTGSGSDRATPAPSTN
jgi:hypothetical protein